MLIGSMNNPKNPLPKEIKWIKKNFDFLDLTLELPNSHPDKVHVRAVRELIDDFPVVGHTAWYLPIGSPFKELRLYALSELEKCVEVFRKLGVEKVNVHFDDSIPLIKDEHTIEFNIWSLQRLVRIGKRHGVKIMAENTPGLFSQPGVLDKVFRKVPELMLHLDIGHANISTKNSTPILIAKFSKHLAHIHISDNNGKKDEHLSLGKGNINWPGMLGVVKDAGYDGTITLEVFTSEKTRVADKPKLRKIWDNL
ncbi:MAG TPA: sugar phosphate isomerase/epimerase family protein [archaeon]|nr:sugar phosphate isomerase/epimerase family protein [archaeon]